MSKNKKEAGDKEAKDGKYVQWVFSREKGAKDGSTLGRSHKDAEYVFIKSINPQNVALGLHRKVLAYCDQAMLINLALEKGAVVASHAHPHAQISYVEEGRFKYMVDGEEKEVGPGDSVCIDSGLKHSVTCLEKGSLVEFFSPMRKDFLR